MTVTSDNGHYLLGPRRREGLAVMERRDACVRERAADPLNGAGIDAKPCGDLAHAFCAPRLVQSRTNSLFQLGGYRRPAELLALRAGPRKTSTGGLNAPRAWQVSTNMMRLPWASCNACCNMCQRTTEARTSERN
jgi:hypothetical protein